MKLLRWAVGGASTYVIYSYSTGRKLKAEAVCVASEKAAAPIGAAETAPAEMPKHKRAPHKEPQAL